MISTTLRLRREDGSIHVVWDGRSDEAVSRLRAMLHLPSGTTALLDQSHPQDGVDSWDLRAAPRVDGGVLVSYEITTADGELHHGLLALPRSSPSGSRRFEHGR